MSREPLGPDDPRFWMGLASNDLLIARDGVRRKYRLDSLCFHAQQAAEKALKAVLVHRQIPFPKVHSIERLMALLPPDLSPSPKVRDSAELSDYAVEGRYPQNFEDVTLQEYRTAIRKAEAVVIWAGRIIMKFADHGGSGVQEAPAPYLALRSSKGRVRPKRRSPKTNKKGRV